MSRRLTVSISLSALILMMPAAQAQQDAGRMIAYIKDAPVYAACSQVKVMSADGRYIIVTATANQSAADTQLLEFACRTADRVFSDKDTELLVVFFEPAGNDRNVRSVSLSRSKWESIKSQPAPVSALAFSPADEASGNVASAQGTVQPLDTQRTQLAERIETLKKKGVGVEPYLKVMEDCESDLKQGSEQAAKEKLDCLTASIESQEKQLASRGTVRLRSGVSQMVSLPPSVTAGRESKPAASASRGIVQVPAQAQNKQPEKPADAYTMMKTLTGLSSINDLGGTQDTAADKLYLMIAAKALGPDCPDVDGPFLWERVRIALRIQELEHQRVQSSSYRSYNRDKIESLVRARNPRYMHQIADNIQYLQRQIGVKELERDNVR